MNDLRALGEKKLGVRIELHLTKQKSQEEHACIPQTTQVGIVKTHFNLLHKCQAMKAFNAAAARQKVRSHRPSVRAARALVVCCCCGHTAPLGHFIYRAHLHIRLYTLLTSLISTLDAIDRASAKQQKRAPSARRRHRRVCTNQHKHTNQNPPPLTPLTTFYTPP